MRRSGWRACGSGPASQLEGVCRSPTRSSQNRGLPESTLQAKTSFEVWARFEWNQQRWEVVYMPQTDEHDVQYLGEA